MLDRASDMVSGLVEQILSDQGEWVRNVLLSELGPNFYGKPDREVALEARRRGYELFNQGTKVELRDKDGNVVSTFKVQFKKEQL